MAAAFGILRCFVALFLDHLVGHGFPHVVLPKALDLQKHKKQTSLGRSHPNGKIASPKARGFLRHFHDFGFHHLKAQEIFQGSLPTMAQDDLDRRIVASRGSPHTWFRGRHNTSIMGMVVEDKQLGKCSRGSPLNP